MSAEIKDEILVWTDREEGHFLTWEDGAWYAFEHHNYRHSFSPPQPVTHKDLQALRRMYSISAGSLADQNLLRTSSRDLVELKERRDAHPQDPASDEIP